MKFFQSTSAVIGTISYLINGVLGQSTTNLITEPNTGITFATAQFDSDTVPGGLTWGYALPSTAATTDATEYIGYLVAPNNAQNAAWSGFSHSGQMIGGLMLQFWPYNGKIVSGFRYATANAAPDIYTGNSTIRVIYSSVNTTAYTVVYRCQNCWQWTYEGTSGSSSTSSGFQLFAWAQAAFPVLVPSDPNSNVDVQHNYSYTFGGLPANAGNAKYSQWATLTVGGSTSTSTSKPASTSTKTSTTTSASSVKTTSTSSVKTTTTTAVSTTTTTSAAISGTPVPTTTYDYIIVGGGAGGIPLADKLSESGKSVLLIERGPASTGQWGGTMKPAWLSGTQLTRFDVPGLDNQIWVDSTGIACNDVGTMAGCILGGGTAINAGLWWNPPDQDFDRLFPTGWKASDMKGAVSRVFSRIPGTYIPSQDGIDYNPSGYNLLAPGFAKAGFTNVTANSVPNQKNKVFTRGPFMYIGAQRGGPLATYMVTAAARKNFKYILNTDVKRVIRNGGHITGVEVQPYLAGGYKGVINVTANTGRVILSAGAFGSARILFRSGIGPTDQLTIVKGSAVDGATLINSTAWINLPVGQNLDDHTNTNIVLSHPNVQFYDFYKAYTNPNSTDTALYLNKKSGILAKSAPNIGPVVFDQVTGTDGIVRQFEYTARIEGWLAAPDNNSMVISQYLGTGGTSRGRATIDSKLNMAISTVPYFRDAADQAAAVTSLTTIVNAVKAISGVTMIYPSPTQSVADYVQNYPGGMVIGQRTANHWVGTAKMGTDDGRSGGTAVVDTNTKVYGTDNLFVVDASIVPAIGTANPSSLIVSVAEQAATKILALASAAIIAKYSQCGGVSYTGSANCAVGSTCQYQNDYYWQCV